MSRDASFPPLTDMTVAIIGLGLMGGSLAAALKGKCKEIIGVDENSKSIQYALQRNWISVGCTHFGSEISQANVLIFAVPVRSILRLIDEIQPFLSPKSIVLDLGSVKTAVMQKMAQLPAYVEVLGGHPMCGKETSGIEVADAKLYEGAKFVLTPIARTKPQTVALGIELVKAIGAQPILLPPEKHDELVSFVSHLPYLLACGLVNSVDEKGREDANVLALAASGFRDTTRLASSNLTMSLDIIMSNREAILKTIGAYKRQWEGIEELIQKGDEAAILSYLTQAWESRVWIKKEKNDEFNHTTY